MTLAIAAHGLHKSVTRGFLRKPWPILRGVNLEVAPGSVHGLVGRNGAGKSTLMRALLGATQVEGRIEVLGRGPHEPASRQGVGFAPDVPSHPETLTPREILSLHASLLGLQADAVDRALETLVLGRIADRPVRGFSKGQAQRVSLAAALLGSPRLLILDEPMSGLDPEGRHLVRTLIRDAQATGTTILFSSHVLADVEDLCDAVTIIDAGRTVASGPVHSMALALGGFKIVTRQRRGDGGALQFVETEVAKEALTTTLVELDRAGAELVSVAPRRRGLEQFLLEVVAPSPSEDR